jgi:uncharacterized repeat protein (TIGR03803 family)
VVQATGGNFFGTTSTTMIGTYFGTVFKITTGGKLTTLHRLDGTDEGSYPYAGLVQANDGNFYGTAREGGNAVCPIGQWGCGTLFKITTEGTFTTVHSFDGTDGAFPQAALVQATDGSFYGTTSVTVFKMTPAGILTTLYRFSCTQTNCPDGAGPSAGLVQATDGNLYGTTPSTIFKITTGGTLTTLHSFNGTDGSYPYAGLFEATNGILYGTTTKGGAYGYGTVFSLSVGLHPFVQIQPTSGKVGAAVIIRGTNLTGATGVTFNGTAATFTVVSGTEITTNVPTGATTGKVKVKTPHGTFTSNVVFRVKL